MKTIDLEEGMPRVQEALARLHERLYALDPSTRAVKLIHGYGASGTGGAIREAVRRQLESMTEAGRIRSFIPGEEWSKVDGATRYWLEVLPALHDDGDLGKSNPGVTIVVLSNPFRSGCGLPKVCCSTNCLREELENQKDRGHVVVKFISPPNAEGSTALTKAFRAFKREGTIKHFVPGEYWTTTHSDTMRWVRKFPQCDSDPNLGSGVKDVFVVFLARRLNKGTWGTVAHRASV